MLYLVMKTRGPSTDLFAILAFCFVAPGLLDAATMSASATAPPVNGLDIANNGAVTGNDKWFFENSAAGAAKGQTFTTGSTPVLLKGTPKNNTLLTINGLRPALACLDL